MHIERPQPGEYPEYYNHYVGLVKEGNILELLFSEHMETMELLTSLDEETLAFRYAPGKWTIREVTQHIMDTERILGYRALCFARGEQASLPGFDENLYATNSNANRRKIDDMVRDLSVARASTTELFKSFDAEQLLRTGTANNKKVSVRSILYFLLGHEIHHRNVIGERYLNG
jgi:uncharacterized damage-inducible protein DinB